MFLVVYYAILSWRSVLSLRLFIYTCKTGD